MRPRAEAAPRSVFAEVLPGPGERLGLAEDESHSLARVVRARVGESVTVTDGRGGRAELELSAIGRVCEGRVTRLEHLARTRTLTLACGAPEGDRGDWLIEKAAELGVSVLQPLDTERGRWERAAAREARWARLARAALRQSRACWALELRTPEPFAVWLGRMPAGPLWLADPAGAPAGAAPAAAQGQTTVAVGPASGFSDAERKALQDNGFQFLSLAPSRLRTETAALAAAAWWAAAPGE